MRQHPIESARPWIEQARADFESAMYTADGRHFDVACFLAQQAVEKALQGFLLWKVGDRPRVHLIGALLNELAVGDCNLAESMREAEMLDQYYTTSRYPDAIGGAIPAAGFKERQARDAVEIARTVVDLIDSLVPPCKPF